MKDRPLSAQPKLSVDIDLLQTIYETALLPDNYDDLIDSWSTRLEEALDAIDDDDMADKEEGLTLDLSDAIRYLNTSLQLFERLNTARQLEMRALESGRTNLPKIVLDADGKVVWYNGAALRIFGLSRQSTARTLEMDAGSRRRLAGELAALAGAGTAEAPAGRDAATPPLVILLQPVGEGAPVFMIGRRLIQPKQPALLALDQADTGWNGAVESVLRGSFGLSPSEIEIVARLAEGHSLSRIAADRNRQVSTLRSQLKAALRKTQTHSQAQLVRLTLSLASHLDAARAEIVDAEVPVRVHPLPDGRRLHYRVLGPPDGAPVVFLHGMLDGLSFAPELVDGLAARRLRLIAPERPWFGAAPGLDCDPAAVPDRVCADIRDLMETLQLTDVRLVGHMAGALYAFTLAACAPQRVRGIVSVAGGVPITSIAQFRHMSPRQRTVAYTARFTPSALPLILQAGVRQIEAGGVDRFVRALYAKSPVDLQVFEDPRSGSALADGVRFAVAQGYRAFEIDSYHVVRDWGHRTQGSACPVILLHGQQDPVVSAASVAGFARTLGARAELRIAEGAGQTILLSHAASVLDAIEAL